MLYVAIVVATAVLSLLDAVLTSKGVSNGHSEVGFIQRRILGVTPTLMSGIAYRVLVLLVLVLLHMPWYAWILPLAAVAWSVQHNARILHRG